MNVPSSGRLRLRNRLFWASVNPDSAAKYQRQLGLFVAWCRRFKRVDVLRLKSASQVDLLFSRFVFSRFRRFAGTRRGYIQWALSALITERPDLKGRLPMAAKALAGWRKLVPSSQYPPFPFEVLLVFAWEARRSGQLDVMVAFLVAWGAYLRVSEVCALRGVDVVFADRTAVLAVHDSKGGRGATQSALIYDGKIVRLLKRWLALAPRTRPHERVVKTSPKELNDFIAFCAAKYGLRACRFSFHSIRHGKASFDLRRLSVESIVVRGRWASVKSARRYFQAGQVILMANARRCRGVMALGRLLRGNFKLFFAFG